MRDPETATLTGTATYRERIALPPDAVVTVRLQDVSRQDVAAETLAEQTIEMQGKQVPVAFELTYDPADIVPSHRYSVRAEIRSGGRLMFASSSAAPVFAEGAPTELELLLTRVRGATPEALALPLRGTKWVLTGIGENGVVTQEGREPAHLLLAEDELRYSGSATINRIAGGLEIDGAELHFQPGPMTEMAGPPDLMEQEQRFVAALAKVDGYSIERDRLTLSSNGETLLVFAAAQDD